jgi:hypothetical protein
MSCKAWGWIFLGACLACVGEIWFGFGLWFAPGWANGWPGGLSIHTVWSGGMAALLFLMLLTLAVGAGAVIGSLCTTSERVPRRGLLLYAAWLAAGAALALMLSCWAFKAIYASTLAMWPNGYNPGLNERPLQSDAE